MSFYDVFLAVAYKPACIEGTGYRLAIESIIECAQEKHFTIYIAPAKENWGNNRPPRREALAHDHAALRGCACFVYFVGGFESDGALVELGMAIALSKRIIILHEESERLSSHVQGLIDTGGAEEGIFGGSGAAFAPLMTLLAIGDPEKN